MSAFQDHEILRQFAMSKAKMPTDVRAAIMRMVDDGWQDSPPSKAQSKQPGRWRVRHADGTDASCAVGTVSQIWRDGSRCRPVAFESSQKNPNVAAFLDRLKELPTLGQCVLVSDVVRTINTTLPKE